MQFFRVVPLGVLVGMILGCGTSSDGISSLEEGKSFANASGSDPLDEDKPFVLGDLVPPFDPPSLEQLGEQVAAAGGWVDRPVLDSLKLLRERQAQEPLLASVNEALALRNDSEENNAKIQNSRKWRYSHLNESFKLSSLRKYQQARNRRGF